MSRFLIGFLLLTLLSSLPARPSSAAPSSLPPKPGPRPELALQIGHNLPVLAVAFSPDGKRLASASRDHTIKVWMTASGAMFRTFTGHKGVVNSVVFSPDGKMIASAGSDMTIRLWNALTGGVTRIFKGHEETVLSVAFSPDGKTLASGSFDGTAKLWDVATGALKGTLTEHNRPIAVVAFSPDGKTLASGSSDRTIKLWDAATRTLRSTLSGSEYSITAMAFSPDGKTLAGSGSPDVLLWDVKSGKQRPSLKGHREVTLGVAFSPDGKALATCSRDNTIKIWDVARRNLLRNMKGKEEQAKCLAFSPDSQTLATDSGDKSIRLWDAASGDVRRTLSGSQNFVTSVAYSPDSQILASGSWDKTVQMWDINMGAVLRVLRGSQSQVESLAFSSDGRLIATGSWDRTIALWDAASGALHATLRGHKAWVMTVAFSPDGRQLVSGSGDGTVKLWDVATGEVLRTIKADESQVDFVAFSPDGRTIASAGSKKVRLWNAATGAESHTLSRHEASITDIAFLPDGKTIASSGADANIRLWDVETGALRRTLSGLRSVANAFAVSPDGKTIASANTNEVKLWDIATSRVRRTLVGHQNTVVAVAFSQDGQRLASGSFDTSVKVWDVAEGRELATLLSLPEVAQERLQAKPISLGDKGPIIMGDKEISLPSGEWLVLTPEGYFDSSANAARYVLWNINGGLVPAERYWKKFRKPDLVRKALRGERIEAPKISSDDIPPEARFLSVQYAGDSEGLSEGHPVSVDVTLEVRGRHDFAADAVQILVNGRPLPPESEKPLDIRSMPMASSGNPMGSEEKAPIVLGDKAIVVGDKAISVGDKPVGPAMPAAAADKFVKRYAFRVPLPLGDAQVRENGYQSVQLRALAYDKEELGSAPATIWLRNQKARQVTGNLYALCVGLSTYRNGIAIQPGARPEAGKIANLTYPDEDAGALAERLQREAKGFYSEVQVHTLLDEQVTLDNLQSELKWLQTQARPGQIDTVIVFLSGHGFSNEQGEYFFPTYDFDPGSEAARRATSLSGVALQNELGSTLPARSVFLFVDSCHSGALSSLAGGERGAVSGEDLSFAVRESGVYLLASSGALQTSLESNAWGHGAFTQALLNSLQSPRVRDGIVHFDELTYLVPDEVVKLLRAASLNESSMQPVVPMEGHYLNEPVVKVQP